MDDLAGYGVHSIVLQVPEEKVTRDGDEVDSAKDKNAVVGVWASTERKRVSVLASHNDDDGDDYVQVSRLGNPLVNEVVIPVGKKDQFNRTTPDRDAELYGQFVVKPELAGILNLLFNVGAPETNRLDIVQAVLQGLPGLNQQGKNPKPVDTIKLNLGIAAGGQPEPPRGARWRPGRLPERPQADRRRGRHRNPGRGGRARRPEGAGRGRLQGAREVPEPDGPGRRRARERQGVL